MKAIIIEDELPSARRLERLLQDFEVEILTTLSSIKNAVSWFKKNEQPHLIFLDVQLSDGLCFEIFKQVKITSKIIFTTAFSNYSIKAFDYNSISYLLKTINKEKLSKAILKATKNHQKDTDLEQFKELLTNYKTEIYKDNFTVKFGRKIKIISSKEIICFYSLENATFIQTSERSYSINHSLTSLENDLNPIYFFRVNRTFIIHKTAIKEITAHSNARLKLVLYSYNESEIIVSREKVKSFKAWLDT